MMTTNTLSVSTELGEELGCWAYAGSVVIELAAEGGAGIDAHMTIAQAEAHVAHMQQQIAAAKAMMPKLLLVADNPDAKANTRAFWNDVLRVVR